MDKVLKERDLDLPKAMSRNEVHSRKLLWLPRTVARWLDVESKDLDAELVEAVYDWQEERGLGADGIVGPNTLAKMQEEFLSDKELVTLKVVMPTIRHESRGKFDAINVDGEYRGRFDKTWKRRKGTIHPASGKTHIGLSIGLLQATQDGGAMGNMLKLFRKTNETLFDSVIGPTGSNLVEITTRKGKSGLRSGVLRGPRCQPVPMELNGEIVYKDLWEDEWVDRIKELLRQPEFAEAQIDFFVRSYLKPIIKDIRKYGLVSERAVSACFDRAIHKGVGGFRGMLESALDGKGNISEAKRAKLMISKDPSTRFKKRYSDKSLSLKEWEGFNHY